MIWVFRLPFFDDNNVFIIFQKVNIVKIVIATDSFKESLTAPQACAAIQRGFAKIAPNVQYVQVPMADGGEGTAAALVSACGGEWVNVRVSDPLGRQVLAKYGVLPNGTAVMEMAEAAGLHLLTLAERNLMKTSTYGVGEMIADALGRGIKRIILGIGGSATNDGGAGMAQALGFRLLDKAGRDLPRGGAALRYLAAVNMSSSLYELDGCEIVVACDVVNPLCGDSGASAVFGKQKGANTQMIRELDTALTNFADVLARNGTDFRDEAGSGAAGGLGFGLRALLGAQLRSGIDIVLEITELANKISGADLVITGEGCMDGQTTFGKVPLGVLRVAQEYGVPVVGLAGSVADVDELYALGFAAVFPSIDRVASLPDVLANAEQNVERTARAIAAIWAL